MNSIIIACIIITFILLPSSSNAIHTISITCKYFKEFRTHIGEVPVCSVVSNDSILYDDTYITSVSHSNKTLTKDSITKHFATLNKFYHFMPQRLSNIFDRLQGLEFVHSKLKVIRAKDMRMHIHLEYLNLRGNDLECIDGDVFYFNVKLKFISLADNKIRRIDTKMFQNLLNIQQFFLNGNYCYSYKANNKYDVDGMKEELSLYCAPLYNKSGHPTKCKQLVELEMENSRKLNRELEREQKINLELKEQLEMQAKINEELRIKS